MQPLGGSQGQEFYFDEGALGTALLNLQYVHIANVASKLGL